MVIYLASLFGYLALLIVVKWIMFGAENCHCAPTLLISMHFPIELPVAV